MGIRMLWKVAACARRCSTGSRLSACRKDGRWVLLEVRADSEAVYSGERWCTVCESFSGAHGDLTPLQMRLQGPFAGMNTNASSHDVTLEVLPN